MKTVAGSTVLAVVTIGLCFGVSSASPANGGYNDMGTKSVYYDSGHDRANAAAMLLALDRNGYGARGTGSHNSSSQRDAAPPGRIQVEIPLLELPAGGRGKIPI